MAIVVHLCKRSVSPEPEGADSSTVNLGKRLLRCPALTVIPLLLWAPIGQQMMF